MRLLFGSSSLSRLAQGSALALALNSLSGCGSDSFNAGAGGAGGDEGASGGSVSTGGTGSATGGAGSGGAGSSTGGATNGSGGALGSGGNSGGPGGTGPCYDQTCAGVCKGDCAGGFTCDEGLVACLTIEAQYCGCDGRLFAASGGCPDRAYKQEGSCEGAFNCDLRDVTCKAIALPCPQGEEREVINGCYGNCVPIANCGCTAQDDCPDPQMIDQYACYMNEGRCGDWVK